MELRSSLFTLYVKEGNQQDSGKEVEACLIHQANYLDLLQKTVNMSTKIATTATLRWPKVVGSKQFVFLLFFAKLVSAKLSICPSFVSAASQNSRQFSSQQHHEGKMKNFPINFCSFEQLHLLEILSLSFRSKQKYEESQMAQQDRSICMQGQRDTARRIRLRYCQ